MRLGSALALAGLALALAGCDRAAEPDRADAGGEILEGSTSDAMLPLDTVRSQPPLAGPTATASGRPGATGTGAAADDDDGASEAESEATATAVPEAMPDAAPPTP